MRKISIAVMLAVQFIGLFLLSDASFPIITNTATNGDMIGIAFLTPIIIGIVLLVAILSVVLFIKAICNKSKWLKILEVIIFIIDIALIMIFAISLKII